MQRDSYKTKQKDLIFKIIKKTRGDFSIKELFAKVNEIDNAVGLTTVYRAVNKMAEEGTVNKVVGQDGSIRYHFEKDCSNGGHCLLKCESCGKIVHEDCEVIEKMVSHFANEHKFAINKNEVVVYGLCKKCKR